jgi:hypothetical protein
VTHGDTRPRLTVLNSLERDADALLEIATREATQNPEPNREVAVAVTGNAMSALERNTLNAVDSMCMAAGYKRDESADFERRVKKCGDPNDPGECKLTDKVKQCGKVFKDSALKPEPCKAEEKSKYEVADDTLDEARLQRSPGSYHHARSYGRPMRRASFWLPKSWNTGRCRQRGIISGPVSVETPRFSTRSAAANARTQTHRPTATRSAKRRTACCSSMRKTG